MEKRSEKEVVVSDADIIYLLLIFCVVKKGFLVQRNRLRVFLPFL